MEALVYFLIWAGLIFVMMRFGCGAHILGRGHGHHSGNTQPNAGRVTPPETAIDPVCGRTVRTASAKPSIHDGTAFYFCSSDCREAFEANPARYPKRTDGRISTGGELVHDQRTAG